MRQNLDADKEILINSEEYGLCERSFKLDISHERKMFCT